MRLLWALIRWFLSRLILFLCIGALVVVYAIFSDWWKQRNSQESELTRLQTEFNELGQQFQKLRNDLSLEKRLLDLREHEPSKWTSPFQWLKWKKEVEVVSDLLDKKNRELRRLRVEKERAWNEIQKTTTLLRQTQQLLISSLKRSITTILMISAFIFLGPICWKAFWYFGLARLAQHAPGIQLETSNHDRKFRASHGEKHCTVILQPGEHLYSRMEWIHQYSSTGKKRTRFLLDWKSPFTSYATGLSELTEVSVVPGSQPAEVVISSGHNPDTYLCEVEIENHPGIVVYPAQVIAITGNVRVKTKWCITNPHAWIAGRLRHIIFYGTGKLFVRGTGGIDPVQISDPPVRISESIVTAFETFLPFSTVRTETFWPYYKQIVPLFDYQFKGEGWILRQTAPDAARVDNASVRFIDAMLNGLSKLLGF
jgi:uncharacterized protein (AIM24 family)